MLTDFEKLDSDFEKAQYLQNILIDCATGGGFFDEGYTQARNYFMSDTVLKQYLPAWVKTNRSLNQFWQFIKIKSNNYAGRRDFIWNEFEQLLSFLESKSNLPPEVDIETTFIRFNSDEINKAWRKALERRQTDPEGAITIARTILESVCKHILDARGVEYNKIKIDLSELYKSTANELNLSPDQHTLKIFKQILGGCSAIVNGLGTLRNKLGDAHGKGMTPVKPKSRHAELAVNLAGSMALFLIQTFEEQKLD